MEKDTARRIAERFIGLTPEKRRLFWQKMNEQGMTPAQLPILAREREAQQALPVSYAQQRQWFMWQLAPESSAYHVAGGLWLTGQVDAKALRASLEAIMARHEVLRTRFVADEAGRVEQWIDGRMRLDWREASPASTQIDAAARALASEPFDLATGPLLRAGLYRSEAGRSLLVLALHHIVSDGWSVQVLLEELVAHYRAAVLGEPLSLATLPVQYADYAAWQREWLEAGEREKQLEYWRKTLGETHPVLALPTDAPRQAHASYRAARHGVTLPVELAQAVRERAQRSSTTPFMVLLAAFQALLHRYTGEGDIRVGVPVANRNRVETEPLIGFFVNTQVLRAEVAARDTLGELLERTRLATLGAQAHQDLPFDVLVDALHTQRSLSHNPLFQVMFNHLRSDYRVLDALPGLAVEWYEFTEGEALFELTLNIVESTDGGLSAQLMYARELFDAATIERFGHHYVNLLRSLAENPAQAVGEVELLDLAERERLHDWAQGTGASDGAPLAHRQFEAHAAAQPDALALMFGDERLSYRELNERANRLAAYLIRAGVGPEVRVGFAMARSVEMLVAQLAILKAGGAYVPLDPAYPAERLAYMIEDSGIELLLVQTHLGMARLPLSGAPGTLDLDTLDVSDEPVDNPTRNPNADNLAYVVYTSGSTGRPKGVAVAHGALAMHCRAVAERYEVSAMDRYLNFASASFDAATEQCLGPLMHGAAIVLRDDEVWSAHRLADEIRSKGISVVNLPPAYLDAFAQSTEAGAVSVRVCIAGGEAWSKSGFEAVCSHLKPQRVFNAYGPSETVITPTLWQFDTASNATAGFDSGYAPIGRPVGDRSAWVLDAQMNRVPQGLPGELYLGGHGMARGYLGRPALTAERFVPDPFADEPGARLYRTGDLVRWRHDGQLEYLGRIDHQVKVRGFRIELGEVEAQLRAQPGVRDAVVDAQEGPGGTRLVGYVSPVPGCTLDTAVLRAGLAATLPDYMVPGVLMVLDALPLNPNGKVDRRALPAPAAVSALESGEAAQGIVETQLAAIWAQLLRREHIGRHENFFELGGDSIMGLQIVARARQAGLLLTARQIFEQQTIAQLATCAVAIHNVDGLPDDSSASSTIEPDAPVPLLPIQAWFFAEPLPERHHWNQAVLLRIDQAIDTACMEQALRAIVAHHDSLRLRFEPCDPVHADDTNWRQRYARSEPTTLLQIATGVRTAAVEALCDTAQRTLDLTHGPLLRALAMQIDDGSWRLFIAIHHLAVDTVSWRILLDDLRRVYMQLQAGEGVKLPARTTSYQVFGRQLQEAARRPEIEQYGAWWQALADVPAALPPGATGAGLDQRVEVNANANDGNESTAKPVSATVRFDAATTSRLLRDASSAYRTQLADLLLVATGRALCRFAGRDVLRIDLEGHGRETHFGAADLSRTTGWFTAVYPFRLAPTGEIGAALKRVKEARRAVPHGGMSFGMLKYLGTPEQRAALSGVGHAEVLFNYLGQFDATLANDANANIDKAGAWQLASERTGHAHSERSRGTHALEIAGQVQGGELSLTWLHANGERYDAATLEALAEDFRQELLAVLAHCESGASGLTPSDVPLAALDQAQLDDLPVPASEIADLYPLAPMQTGIVFHSLLGQQPGAYVNQLRVDIDRLDCARFQAAWEAAAARHDILRTGFLAFDDASRQWVARSVAVPFSVEDWRDVSARDTSDAPALATRLDAFAAAQIERGFDLARPPLWRVTLIRTGAERYHLVWTFHHALLDGWSAAQLLAEVLGAYEGRKPTESPARYRQFIAWLQARGRDAGEAWWRVQIGGLDGPTLLASALAKPAAVDAADAVPATTHASTTRIWDATHTAQLSAFAKAQRVTLNTLVQAAWLVLLQRYTGQRTVTFGATVAGRPASLEGAERTLGLFINTIPVIATPQPSLSVGQWLEQIQQHGVAAREHEHVALYDIQRWAKIEGGQALFDSLVVFENYPVDEILEAATPRELQFSGQRNEDRTSYPLTLSISHGRHARHTDASPDGESLRIEFAYTCDAFDASQIERLAAHLAALLDAFAANPAAPLGSLAMLDDTELGQQQQWGAGPEIAQAPLVHQRIARQAETYGAKQALVLDGESLDYDTLERRTSRLAHRLQAAGVGPESRVGIAIERSFEMIVAVLAVLKAGGAYVPLDPSYPAERLAFMIEDSGIELALTSGASADALAQFGVACIDVTQSASPASAYPDRGHHADDAPSSNVSRDNLAYVIYTSGSTGRPKGVGITHDALAQHTQVSIDLFGVTAEDRVLQFSTFNFDGFVEQVFATLSVGAALILRGPQLWSSERFLDEVVRQRITVADLTTAYWNVLAQDFAVNPRARAACASLRRVHAGGEAMPADGILAWRMAGLAHVALANTYGPSEATVTASAFDCSPYLQAAAEVPAQISIGGPLAGRSLRVLDAQLNPVPVGVAGELCIGGALLARGYHGRAGLTAERFIADPHAASPGGRLYRTGDLVRWNAHGTLDYLGRLDHQVKVRGFRIELGEIEAQLLRLPTVREAVAVVREGTGGARVLAYVAAAPNAQLDGSTLRASLAATLPDYMVPSTVLVLDALPLNPNGKIDRHALPLPGAHEAVAAGMSEAADPPQGELETALAAIWSTVLDVQPVQRSDRFFELGGHSLAAMQVQASIRRTLGIDAQLADLMNNQPLYRLAQTLMSTGRVAQDDDAMAAEMQDILAEL